MTSKLACAESLGKPVIDISNTRCTTTLASTGDHIEIYLRATNGKIHSLESQTQAEAAVEGLLMGRRCVYNGKEFTRLPMFSRRNPDLQYCPLFNCRHSLEMKLRPPFASSLKMLQKTFTPRCHCDWPLKRGTHAWCDCCSTQRQQSTTLQAWWEDHRCHLLLGSEARP